MMDNFHEEIVVRQKTGIYNFLFFLAWAVMIVSALMAVSAVQNLLFFFVDHSFQISNVIVFVVCGGIAALLWKYKDRLRTEYEYTFTNGDLDVARVLNNQKRQYLTCLSMKNVEAAGPVNSPAFQRYVTMPDVKKHNWFLNRDAKLYYFFFTKNQNKHLMIVELSDEMVSLTRKAGYMNYGVWQE